MLKIALAGMLVSAPAFAALNMGVAAPGFSTGILFTITKE
jgi:hypothetical protein